MHPRDRNGPRPLSGKALLSDTAFERTLLHSAKADHLPDGGTGEAWSRFQALLNGTVHLADPGSKDGPTVSRALHRPRLAWFAAGTVVGAALTATLMSSFLARRTTEGPNTTAHSHAPASGRMTPPENLPESTESGDTPEALTRASSTDVASTTQDVAEGQSNQPPRAPSGVTEISPQLASEPERALGTKASTLAAEVRALDRILAAIDTDNFDGAVALVTAFHTEFRRAQLTADADALAIEALQASGDHRAAQARAAQFLRRHPKDPHAARFEALVQR